MTTTAYLQGTVSLSQARPPWGRTPLKNTELCGPEPEHTLPDGSSLGAPIAGLPALSGTPRLYPMLPAVGRILVNCKTRLQVPDSRVQVWSQQSCLRRDKISYFGKVLQNSPLTSHKIKLNRAILTMILPCP